MKEYDELKLEINDNEIIETETKSNKKLEGFIIMSKLGHNKPQFL